MVTFTQDDLRQDLLEEDYMEECFRPLIQKKRLLMQEATNRWLIMHVLRVL